MTTQGIRKRFRKAVLRTKTPTNVKTIYKDTKPETRKVKKMKTKNRKETYRNLYP